jgi:flagellar hook-length control protein FliK
MQMLPATLPNTPSAARVGKPSDSSTEGVFQSVLNQQSGKANKAEPTSVPQQSEAKSAKRHTTESSTTKEKAKETAPDAMPDADAQALAAAQNLVPTRSNSLQGQIPDGSELDAVSSIQTDLHVATEQADQEHPFDLADGKTITEQLSETAKPSANGAQQLSNALSPAATSEQAKTYSSVQQIATTQNAQIPAILPGTLGSGTAPSLKAKSTSLGDHRFAQLLGRGDTPGSELSGTKITAGENSVSGLSENTDMTPAAQTLTANDGHSLLQQDSGNGKSNGTHSVGMETLQAVGEETSPSLPEDQALQLNALVSESPTSGSNEMSGGINANNGQAPMLGNLMTPGSSVVHTSAAQEASLQQKSGFFVPEQDVMEQVIQRSSLRELEGKRHLTVELHPEDLGQVKLNLVQEQDRLQLHLQAQSSEVRDILEKHLPRLQEALQQQGLRLETIQVSVDAQRNNAQGFFERQQQQQAQQNPWRHANRSSLQSEEQHLPIQANRQSSDKGLSLRI